MRLFALSLICLLLPAFDEVPPTFALGSPAPGFSLPGIDGRTHTLGEYASSKVLVVIFTCSHCPAAQLYEARIQKLVEDYRGKSVAIVAIEPNDPVRTPWGTGRGGRRSRS